MCGIAGIFNYADPERAVDRDLLVRMTRSLAHRGPDAEGFHFKDNIGLGHRRLSIVDLSPTGAQPMATDDGACWITYNGEFYNHAEFRERLSARGGGFRGTSDTETLLRLMEQEGPDGLAGISGIFAFAFWDSRSRALTLARDHMGVKQVYYHDDGRRIAFASEIKALLQDPSIPREPDPEAVNQYLHFHTALFERTFFRNIRVLRAGEYLRVTRYGANLRTYWSLQDFTHSDRADGELVKEMGEQLAQAVGRQLMSDVPVGSFFSGGIDSSAIAAQAAKAGENPLCFGAHFSGQGVTDERPYQEAAAKALGLDLQLITMDGSNFPEEFTRLMYHQDEPVIGAAMFPMAKVSQLAASQVKVCLGGQAADELFGGYARYALGRPTQVLRSWFAGRQTLPGQADAGERTAGGRFAGNLARQFAEGGTLYRLAKNARHLAHWETSYFEHFAKVPEEAWLRAFAAPEFCSRAQCRQIFHETVTRSSARDPLDKVMHWDVQTYLTGLFHQDDRMSMAASLESRVPFADPKMVKFAFHVDPDLKLRGGASKWILRQAVAGVLPPLVLNRRKVGFDTPAQRWITEQHLGFVRDMFGSARSRQRGFWNPAEIERLLGHAGGARSFDILWKLLSIEVWASVFLDGEKLADLPGEERAANVRSLPEPAASEGRAPTRFAHLVQECREMGVKGTLARGLWEAQTRTGLVRLKSTADEQTAGEFEFPEPGSPKLPFADPAEVGGVMREILPARELARLSHLASEATRGRILCFSSWMADYSNPIDWHRDPTNGYRYSADAHWSRVLRNNARVDVKFAWEAARFPHSYLMARAAACDPDSVADLAEAFATQLIGFVESNPAGKGVHWFSGQEVAVRSMAWLFGYHVFSSLGKMPGTVGIALGTSLAASGAHLLAHISYARDSVYNNHLISEALGLYIAGKLTPGSAPARWRDEGLEILIEQAGRQVYSDGAYIQQSHNYHRVAMQLYLWAFSFARANGEKIPAEWTAAMERSLDFLLAHQNPSNGWLPNYGANDGSLPVPLSSCELADFRPILQALSIATRGERIYEPGPWDETSVWYFGARALDLPLRRNDAKSVSLLPTGYHVLRGARPESFCAFRCGPIADRFSQIDMLQLDVWWRGQNVLVDGGTYRYNGAHAWHNHFFRTESHNTLTVDGDDQMLHFRQFKTLFRTEGRLLRFEDYPEWAVCEGEHYGYRRERKCVHRRAVLFVKDYAWVVADTVTGDGTHDARLHWLGGDFPWEFDASNGALVLSTPEGPFSVSVFDRAGARMERAEVVAGEEHPPRGWQSRSYGEKVPVPSVSARASGRVPLSFVSILCAGTPVVSVCDGEWTVNVCENAFRFRIEDMSFVHVELTAVPESSPAVGELA